MLLIKNKGRKADVPFRNDFTAPSVKKERRGALKPRRTSKVRAEKFEGRAGDRPPFDR
jgi:hypothetical protein